MKLGHHRKKSHYFAKQDVFIIKDGLNPRRIKKYLLTKGGDSKLMSEDCQKSVWTKRPGRMRAAKAQNRKMTSEIKDRNEECISEINK